MAVIRRANITKYWGWDVAEEMSGLLHMKAANTVLGGGAGDKVWGI